MSFHSFEQAAGAQRAHVGTWGSAREAAAWLKDRSERIDEADLYMANPVARAYFAELRLNAGQAVTWTVGNGPNTRYLTVEPATPPGRHQAPTPAAG
jgi:hypothetical protein